MISDEIIHGTHRHDHLNQAPGGLMIGFVPMVFLDVMLGQNAEQSRSKRHHRPGIDSAQGVARQLCVSGVQPYNAGGKVMALPSLWRSTREREELLPSRDIWDPFASLRRDMERVFEDFSRDFGWGPPTTADMATAPRIDVSETDAEIKMEAELPGVEEKDVEVVLSDGRLTIKGEKKQEKKEKKQDYYVHERSYGSFTRSVTLPFDADPDKVKAKFANGVLTITLPKPPEVKAKAKKIPVGKG